jgi:hypothetical protein
MCRKAHGAAFGSYGLARAADSTVAAGDGLIVRYRSSHGIVRSFCARCGATLLWERERSPELVAVALGVLDDDPGVRPSKHYHVASKAPWFDIGDDLPQHAQGTQPG